MNKLPESNWVSKALYDSNPGFGAVVSITFGDDKRSFFHTSHGWMVDDDFDYDAVAQNTVPTAISVIYEGRRISPVRAPYSHEIVSQVVRDSHKHTAPQNGLQGF